jgi:hypothetical protein
MTKLFLISGIVWFLLIDVLIFAIYRKNGGRSLSVHPTDVYTTCIIVGAPLLVGMQGFFSVRKLMTGRQQTDLMTLKKLAHLFSFGIIAAYGALISLMVFLESLRP